MVTYKGVAAFDSCPAWLRDKYREAVNHVCQECCKHEDEVGRLEAHRIVRGNEGGMYTVCKLNHKSNNVKIVCKTCHKRLHGGEFDHVSHSY